MKKGPASSNLIQETLFVRVTFLDHLSEIFSNCHRPRASKMPINSSRRQASNFGRTRTDGRGHQRIRVRTDVINASRKNVN